MAVALGNTPAADRTSCQGTSARTAATNGDGEHLEIEPDVSGEFGMQLMTQSCGR